MSTDFDPPLHPLESHGWKSDYVLSYQSAKEFHELHRTVSASLGRLDSEIARVQATLDKLLQERALYVSRIDKINSTVALHKKIPAEILSQVFNYTIDQTIHIDLDRNSFKTHDMPISSQICSRWRQVTLTTQKFWNSIQIKCIIGDWEYSDEIIRVAHTIVSRGSGHVELCLTDTRDKPRAHHLNIPGLIHIISLAKRISLSTLSSQRLLHDVLEISPPFFPILESVEISDSGPGYSGVDIEKCCIFNNAPRLFGVRFLNLKERILISQPSFELPWVQLQSLAIFNPISLAAAHSILSRCPRLTHCGLKIGGDGGQTTVSPSFSCGSISLPHLFGLNIEFSSESGEVPQTEAVLEPLVLPSLYILSIHPLATDSWYTSIMHLIDRSKCSLKGFSVNPGVSEIPEGALDLFRELSPTLILFHMDSTKISIEMLAQITRGDLFPQLQSFRCRIDQSDAALEGLMAMMRHRCLGVSTRGASHILSVEARYTRDGRVARWADAVDEFDALAKEVAKTGCTAVLKIS